MYYSEHVSYYIVYKDHTSDIKQTTLKTYPKIKITFNLEN